MLVEALVAQSTVEALDEAILHRLAWCNVMPFDATLLLCVGIALNRPFPRDGKVGYCFLFIATLAEMPPQQLRLTFDNVWESAFQN